VNWEDVKEQYKGVERAVLIINDYLELGNYERVGKKYNTTQHIVRASVCTQKDNLLEQYPELYKKYIRISVNSKGKVDGKINRKNYITKDSAGRKEWEKIKKEYIGVERALFIIRESLKEGQVKAVADRYNMPTGSLIKIITMNKDTLLENYYEEYMQYKEQCRKRQGERGVRLKRFNKDVFKELNKEIYSEDFLNFIIDYNVGERSTIDIMKIAKKQGIRVFDYTVEGNKKFVV
jgi:hypothetical protein